MTAQELYDKCFGQVWPNLRDLYRAKEVELVYSADSGADGQIVTSEQAFNDVLNGILASALTQTLRGTEVRVSVGSTQKQIVLSVRDHGPGMESGQIEKLYRIDLLRSYGAKCDCKSRDFTTFPDNHGTQITITL